MTFFNSTTNPMAQNPGKRTFASQYCTTSEKVKAGKPFTQPEFARYKLLYSGHLAKNPASYGIYYSIDVDSATGKYDENAGLQELIERMILRKPQHFTIWAKLYINLTLDLDTRKKNYNHEVAYFKGHKNYMPEFRPVYIERNNGIRIAITDTLLAIRPIEEWNENRKIYLKR